MEVLSTIDSLVRGRIVYVRMVMTATSQCLSLVVLANGFSICKEIYLHIQLWKPQFKLCSYYSAAMRQWISYIMPPCLGFFSCFNFCDKLSLCRPSWCKSHDLSASSPGEITSVYHCVGPQFFKWYDNYLNYCYLLIINKIVRAALSRTPERQ